MTIVIADTEETVVFAADSAAANGNEIYTLDTEKVFKRDGYLFGYSGSYRIGQILRHCVELPEYPEESTDMERFMVRELAPAIRKAVLSEGAGGSGRGFLGDRTCILTCIRGQIWNIGPDLTVNRESPFAAIGSGRLRAYAALHALRAAGIKSVHRRIRLALEATAEFTSDVRPPWLVVEEPQRSHGGRDPIAEMDPARRISGEQPTATAEGAGPSRSVQGEDGDGSGGE